MLIEHYGLELKRPIIDRDGGSHAIGRKGENAYDSPTFAREDDALRWVLDNPEAAERIGKGEPAHIGLWLIGRMEAAAAGAASAEAFLEALSEDLGKVEMEAERHRDDELRDVTDAIRAMGGKEPAEIIT